MPDTSSSRLSLMGEVFARATRQGPDRANSMRLRMCIYMMRMLYKYE